MMLMGRGGGKSHLCGVELMCNASLLQHRMILHWSQILIKVQYSVGMMIMV